MCEIPRSSLTFLPSQAGNSPGADPHPHPTPVLSLMAVMSPTTEAQETLRPVLWLLLGPCPTKSTVHTSLA